MFDNVTCIKLQHMLGAKTIAIVYIMKAYACGRVDRALDSRSKGLGFDSYCCSYVEVSGKFLNSVPSWATQQ